MTFDLLNEHWLDANVDARVSTLATSFLHTYRARQNAAVA